MKLPGPRISGQLLKRYKRFLADIKLDDGTTITAHTPNTGSMLGVCVSGSRVWLHDSGNPQRKYLHTWDMVQTLEGVLVGIHTGYANKLVQEAIANGVIHQLQHYLHCHAEVTSPLASGTRFDFALTDPNKPPCYVEVKNVTAITPDNTAIFPDAVTARGLKHLHALENLVNKGHRAVLCFCVQREDAHAVRPADTIDPEYGQALRQAIYHGVEVIAYGANVSKDEIYLCQKLPVILE